MTRIAALAFLLAATSAQAQSRSCGMYDQISEILRQAHGEEHLASGEVGTGATVEIFANEETGSWTILVAMPNGGACAAASGVGFATEVAASSELPNEAPQKAAGGRDER